jgi:Rha family phage regulatory protein
MKTKPQKPHQEIAEVIEVHHGKPMVSSLKVAEMFVRRHDNVLKSIRKVYQKDEGALLQMEGSYLDKSGKESVVYWLNEEQSLTIMPFIGGDQAVEGQKKLVKAYLYYRDSFKEPPRKGLVQAKRDEHTPMMDTLKFARELAGKETGRNHYINENKFCNRALTGKWAALDESALDNYDLTLLAAIRRHNAMLIPYFSKQADRRDRLDAFVSDYRAKNPRTSLAAP